MNVPLTLFAGAALGLAAGSLLVPLTRRELAASVARSTSGDAPVATAELSAPRIARAHAVALAAASGLLLAVRAVPSRLVLQRAAAPAPAGGLVQLAYCDVTRRLLPKTLVYALTIAVVGSGVVVA